MNKGKEMRRILKEVKGVKTKYVRVVCYKDIKGVRQISDIIEFERSKAFRKDGTFASHVKNKLADFFKGEAVREIVVEPVAE